MLVISCFLLIISGLSLRFEILPDSISKYVSVPFAPVQKLISLGTAKVENAVNFFRDIEAVRQENIELKEKIIEVEKENRDLKEYRQENVELRQALNIKDQFASYEPMGSNIIAKDMGNWFDTFTVDRGSRDGIGKNFPVVTSKGLVGRVVQTNANSSKVESIIDKDSVISVRISQKGDLARIRGDIQYSDLGVCILDRIPPEADVAVGDLIETSGIGGIYPRGILVGKVIEVRKANDDLNKYAIVQPAADFRRLDKVFILKDKAGEK